MALYHLKLIDEEEFETHIIDSGNDTVYKIR